MRNSTLRRRCISTWPQLRYSLLYFGNYSARTLCIRHPRGRTWFAVRAHICELGTRALFFIEASLLRFGDSFWNVPMSALQAGYVGCTHVSAWTSIITTSQSHIFAPHNLRYNLADLRHVRKSLFERVAIVSCGTLSRQLTTQRC